MKAFASQRLGLSFEEIADTTPIEFDELCEHYIDKVNSDNIRFGNVCAAIYNQHRQKESDHLFTWESFFPKLILPEDTPEPESQVIDDAQSKLRGIVFDSFAVDIKTRGKILKAEQKRNQDVREQRRKRSTR